MAFGSYIREGFASTRQPKKVAVSTVRDYIQNVATGFKRIGKPDPRLDIDGVICWRLQQLFRGYERLDPQRKQQKALPVSVLTLLVHLANVSHDPLSLAIGQLSAQAFFYAMRSYEYSKTCSREESNVPNYSVSAISDFFMAVNNYPMTTPDSTWRTS